MRRERLKTALLGASGYAGAELLRLFAHHGGFELKAATASSHAGQTTGALFPHLLQTEWDVPLVPLEDVRFETIEAVFCALPHGTTQVLCARLLDTYPDIKIVDLSADFRLWAPELYEATYKTPHRAAAWQKKAVYGLTEWFRDPIREARLVANPGCYPTAVELGLMPLLREKIIDPAFLVVHASSGVTGAGRAAKVPKLLSELSENYYPYGLGTHRHYPEIQQLLAHAAGPEQTLRLNFTPHLLPVRRGILADCVVQLASGFRPGDARDALAARYHGETFVKLRPPGCVPTLAETRGSNQCHLNVFEGNTPELLNVVVSLDNLVKGAAGQAVQNMNLMQGLEPHRGLETLSFVP